jgi:hypothetical protein
MIPAEDALNRPRFLGGTLVKVEVPEWSREQVAANSLPWLRRAVYNQLAPAVEQNINARPIPALLAPLIPAFSKELDGESTRPCKGH